MKPKSTIRGWMAGVGLFAIWLASLNGLVATKLGFDETFAIMAFPLCIGGGIGVLVSGTVKGFMKGTAIVTATMIVAFLLLLTLVSL